MSILPANNTPLSWFEDNPKKTVFFLIFFFGLLLVTATEAALRTFMGLGNPVLYNSNPFYGYRPIPNQSIQRFHGAEIRINNLGLRADVNWDSDPKSKIAFFGDSVTYGGSYISNSELFSAIAASHVKSHKAGNAGVNAWGVENIHGLIVESSFTPANVYVTVLPEKDFYRGLVRLQGLPFWSRKPSSAFQEVLFYFYYRQNNKRYRRWQEFSDTEETNRVLQQAARKLKEIDIFLKKKGFEHLIYITPSREQVLNNSEKDPAVMAALQNNSIEANYILDRINRDKPSNQNLFHDAIHLEKAGHKLWGEIIGTDLASMLDTAK